jgi:TDG/mug DNA glycosylase family protein
VFDARTRLLILGSLPGAVSLRQQQYYGHPRNQFWHLVGGMAGVDLAALSYSDRLKSLLERGIGLWDVIAEAVRPGSLDQNIRNAVPNALAQLVGTLPALRAIGFNGTTATRLGRQQLEKHSWEYLAAPPALVSLPSSSPANTLAYAQKAEAWNGLRLYL